jgi:protein-tyrosine kinase
LSLIENSLERLRRAAGSSKPSGNAAVREPLAVLREPAATAEARCAHRRTSIDLTRLRAQGYLPDAAQERRFADWCHRVKRPIIERALAEAGSDDARLVLLTSALPGDGKSFITLNLALSMARERDISVLLVDGDLPCAQISRVLGLSHEPGLLNALRDERLDVESLVFDTEIPRLELLAAGSPPEGASELVASLRMREISARLLSRDPRRLILFDSPPVLVSSEARALMAIPGQILLVARSSRTPQRAVVDAVSQIDKQRLRGLVLNDALVGSTHGYYGYGYDYPSPSDPAR